MEFISCQLEILGIMTIRLLLKRTGLTMRMKGGDYIGHGTRKLGASWGRPHGIVQICYGSVLNGR